MKPYTKHEDVFGHTMVASGILGLFFLFLFSWKLFVAILLLAISYVSGSMLKDSIKNREEKDGKI